MTSKYVYQLIYVCCSILFLLSSCSNTNSSGTDDAVSITSQNPTTEPLELPSDEASLQEPYPPPDNTQESASAVLVTPIQFQLKKPIFEGAEVVNGSGPPNIPIQIIDITFMGHLLGNGVIDSDGKFEIDVNPLEKNHRIGIGLGNLEGTEFSPNNFIDDGFNGNEALQVPMVGFFFDTTLIQESE